MNENGKSVLFLQGRFTVGGVERVTVHLANAFVEKGWKVTVSVFKIEQRDLLCQLHKDVEVRELGFPVYSLRNVRQLKALMQERRVTHVINQWAFPFPVTAMLRIAMPKGAKLACVFHTMPNKSRRINEAIGLKQRLVTWLVKINSKLVYRFCHTYVVLSESYKKVFEDFTGILDHKKLHAISNPYKPSDLPSVEKENVILYVGRLSATEKRVDRVIDVWSKICERLPDWRLEILGDGPDRTALEKRAKNLPRLSFRGFQNPTSWYAKAKILLLTSDFEGFPMTLVEAMAARCVPIVYGCFSTATEIVHQDAGIVFPSPWDGDKFAAEVVSLANDQGRMNEMFALAQKSVGRYDVGKIADRYIALLEGALDK